MDEESAGHLAVSPLQGDQLARVAGMLTSAAFAKLPQMSPRAMATVLHA